jgi:hypothetical protein
LSATTQHFILTASAVSFNLKSAEGPQSLMRVVLDTNILVSALIVQAEHPDAIYRAWRERYFTPLTCMEQLDELRATLL